MSQHSQFLFLWNSIRYELRSWVAQYPKLFFPLIHFKKSSRSYALSQQTQLVIEGFPGSSNSYAEAAFTLRQPKPVIVAHHLHAPAQVILAARRGIPTLVVIRAPEDAVVSFLTRFPNISPYQALRNYIRFYTRIQPYRERYILSVFEEVTSNFDRVVHRINKHFGTDFSVNCYNNRSLNRFITNLSEESKMYKFKLREEVKSDKLKPILSKAQSVYQELTNTIDTSN